MGGYPQIYSIPFSKEQKFVGKCNGIDIIEELSPNWTKV